MRGKGPPGADVWKRSGITPAYAGKRKFEKHTAADFEDHPRLCGEKAYHSLNDFPCSGSPPPMRGKGYASTVFALGAGITPAYAGKRL